VRRFHHGGHDRPRTRLADLVAARDYAQRLETLRGLTPCEHVARCRTDEPDRSKVDPRHHTQGPNGQGGERRMAGTKVPDELIDSAEHNHPYRAYGCDRAHSILRCDTSPILL
jgi:hypothetical protein